ncbi:hypothetical protein K7X08_007708 [Anisodus acutangulus]|uniref:L-ascorbate oxidase homolog n=1 Tax=Anisodus acutangulus TaxID=402998 RepID=A0A9Q1RNH3_9SOLA|nr:hypothetical protein K7X08_007708 [Anisodus acutangulus]
MERTSLTVVALLVCLSVAVVKGEDPYLFFEWNVTYGTISPLGVPLQGILINGQLPGPRINCTSNNNIVVNVFNHLDEPLLLTWNGVQQRKNSWQDGTPGTMCPIMPGTNFTYRFQVKDQIGSFFYFPTTDLHRAAGGFGGINVHSRALIPVPFDNPADEYNVFVGDWYNKGYKSLKKILDGGRTIGRPDGIHINGKSSKVGDKVAESLFTIEAGKTYRFLKQAHLSSVAIIRYANGKGPASSDLPTPPPENTEGIAWSINQFRSFRWNLTASAARPNPQGSYHYGQINITRTFKIVNSRSEVDGKLRFALNGISHTDADTPFKLAEYFGATEKFFKYDLMADEFQTDLNKVTVAPNIKNGTFRNFVEIIFENREKTIQTYHLDGYSFFAVAIEPGMWSPEKRKNYNLVDAINRHSIQVYPKSWAAVMTTLDNAGLWNLRSEMWERFYLGQQLYFSVLSPARSLRDEYNLPDNHPLCGVVKGMTMPSPYKA